MSAPIEIPIQYDMSEATGSRLSAWHPRERLPAVGRTPSPMLALLWSIGLFVAALVAPVDGSATLVEENGRGVLLVLAVPTVISAAERIALWRKCSRGSRVSGNVAWACVGVLTVFSVVGMLSIGPVVLPVALLLAIAAALTPEVATPGGEPPTPSGA